MKISSWRCSVVFPCLTHSQYDVENGHKELPVFRCGAVFIKKNFEENLDHVQKKITHDKLASVMTSQKVSLCCMILLQKRKVT